jgi:hypothetical protein
MSEDPPEPYRALERALLLRPIDTACSSKPSIGAVVAALILVSGST